jgi:alcohol dehydrogenase class IV
MGPVSERDFTWRDAERTIVFRAAALADSAEVLGGVVWERFELLTTTRALGAAPIELAERASAVHQVGPGEVPYVAAGIIDSVRNPTLVALGGGRVIDTAKAIAALRGGRVCAIPTTLSGAEMTRGHRLPAGREVYARRRVRPVLVIGDPLEMTTLDDRRLRASAINALAHGAEALYVPTANPVASLAALRGAQLIASALDLPADERDRSALALGALLCGYAVDSAGYALVHVICQTLVRVTGTPHAETYAATLPRAMDAMRERAPEQVGSFARALGVEADEIRSRIEALGGGARRLRDLGGNPDRLEAACHAMLQREELANTPDPPGPEELRRLLEDAW